MKLKHKCPKCGKVTYLTGLINSRKRVTRFNKRCNDLIPCIHCDETTVVMLNEALEVAGGNARFKEK